MHLVPLRDEDLLANPKLMLDIIHNLAPAALVSPGAAYGPPGPAAKPSPVKTDGGAVMNLRNAAAKKAATKRASNFGFPRPAPAKSPAPAKNLSKLADPVAPKKSGAKRSPEAMANLLERLVVYITATPGQGAEAIGRALNLSTGEMSLPIRKLVASGKVRAEGVKRATRYYPPRG